MHTLIRQCDIGDLYEIAGAVHWFQCANKLAILDRVHIHCAILQEKSE